MSDLHQLSCEACRADAPKVTADEAEGYLSQLNQWQIINLDDIQRLTRDYSFKDFVSALAFTNQVGELAEAENHHPDITTAWGKVTVTWWTHKIKGLHKNDFIAAAKTDALYNNS